MGLPLLSTKPSASTEGLNDLQRRAVGAYLGLAVGDALGATTEFMTPGEIRHQHGVHRDIVGGGWLHLKAGQVTDDTEMSLALGKAILQQRRVDAHAIAEAFSEWMRSKPVDIGNTVRRGLVHFRTTGEPCVALDDQNAGNGACMRCLPVALLHWNSGEADLLEASRAQAHITHHSGVADAGTETVLRMLVAALNGKALSVLREHAQRLVARYPEFDFNRRPIGNPSAWIVETLKAVFQALFTHKELEPTLIDVVNRGGDADTTGAIAGMLCGALYGIEAIPLRWLKQLDGEVAAACREQALQLIDMAPPGKAERET